MTALAPVRTDRPAYRPYRATVAALRPLSPHFTRVSLRSADFAHFGDERLDQRIKLVFPLPDGTLSDLGVDDEEALAAGDWYERWRALPEERRNPFRTYTVRDVDRAEGRVDIDFVVHGHGDVDGLAGDGPAARWLAAAAVGDELVIVGPDARSRHTGVGIDWRPGEARELLLAGDETAVPAIASILETLPAGRTARAFVEVPRAEDALDLALPEHASVTWLARGDAQNGAELLPAVRAWLAANPAIVAGAAAGRRQRLEDVDIDTEVLWELPEHTDAGFYAWIAGESAAVKALRRLLVRDHGIDRERVAFMGYWRLGKAEN